MDCKAVQREGQLHKWTNYVRGYQKRWFVLQNGFLSYYRYIAFVFTSFRNQAEMAHTCRGTINLINAEFAKTSSVSFIISNSSTQTFHLRAGTATDMEKWFNDLCEAKKCAIALRKDNDDSEQYTEGEDDAKGSSNDSEDGVSLIDSYVKNIEARLLDLQQKQEILNRKASDLKRVFNEIGQITDPTQMLDRYEFLPDILTVYQVTTQAIVNSCADFVEFGKTNAHKWQRVFVKQNQKCASFDRVIADLANQYRLLESQARHNSSQAALGLAASIPSSLPGTAVRVGKVHRKLTESPSISYNRSPSIDDSSRRLGTQTIQHSHPPCSSSSSSDHDEDEEDEHFSDAMESLSEFTVTLGSGPSDEKQQDTDRHMTSATNGPLPVPEDTRFEYESDVFESDYEPDASTLAEEAGQSYTLASPSREARVIQLHGKHSSDSRAMSTEKVQPDDATSQELSIIPKRDAIKRRQSIQYRPNISLNLWSFIKNCVGRELSKIAMPVNFGEPLSMLQRLTEDFEYSSCLDAAARCQDPLEQMAYVSAFTVSAYSTTSSRTGKPFNPILNETFECDRTDDLGWRSLAEQISHHPPKCAMHCESDAWYCWFDFSMNSKFRGKYLQINPIGTCHLVFRRTGHHYTWQKIPMTVNNIIVGTLWIDNSGEMDIVNHTTGDKCHLSYKAYSYFSKTTPRTVTGVVTDKHDTTHYVLNGTWDKFIEVAPVLTRQRDRNQKQTLVTGPPRVIWKATPLDDEAKRMYHFTNLAIQLNQPERGVALTDSRLRPDQRLMEQGQWDEANRAKKALEDKQRSRRHQMALDLATKQLCEELQLSLPNASASQPPNELVERPTSTHIASCYETVDKMHKPLWFAKTIDKDTGQEVQMFTGEYWTAKSSADWSKCPDIYGVDHCQ